MKSRSSPGGRHRRILETLRGQGPRTAQELSTLLGGRPVAMRVHLRQLKAAGLVEYDEEHRTIGRPVRRFRVTPQADPFFPKHYGLLAAHLAKGVVSHFGTGGLDRILVSWRDQIARHLDRRLPPEPGERLKALARHQSEWGFMAAVEMEEGGAALVERNCPVAQVARDFPRLCDYEAALFRKVLGRNVTLACCQARGDVVCRFKISKR